MRDSTVRCDISHYVLRGPGAGRPDFNATSDDMLYRRPAMESKRPLDIVTLEFGCSMTGRTKNGQMSIIIKKWNEEIH